MTRPHPTPRAQRYRITPWCAAALPCLLLASHASAQWRLTDQDTTCRIGRTGNGGPFAGQLGVGNFSWSHFLDWTGTQSFDTRASVSCTTTVGSSSVLTVFHQSGEYIGFQPCVPIGCSSGPGASLEQRVFFTVDQPCVAELSINTSVDFQNCVQYFGSGGTYSMLSGPWGAIGATTGDPYIILSGGSPAVGYRLHDPIRPITGSMQLHLLPGDYLHYVVSGTVIDMHPQAGSVHVSSTHQVRVVSSCPRIVEQPRSQTACTGATIGLRFAVTGPGPWTFTWHRDNQPVNSFTTNRAFELDSVVTAVLWLENFDQAQAGVYHCVASTPHGLCTNISSAPATIGLAPICDGACCDDASGDCLLPGPSGCPSTHEFMPGQTCTPNPCQPLLIPCCFGSTCQLVAFDDCDLAGLGPTSCSPDICDPYVTCCDPLHAACFTRQTCPAGTISLLGAACEPINPCASPGASPPSNFPPFWGQPIWRGGACCMGPECAVTISAYACEVASGLFIAGPVTCNTVGNDQVPCCRADINGSGGDEPLTVQDIFDFLEYYFAQHPRGDFNRSGDWSVQDIFDFLAAYFAGC